MDTTIIKDFFDWLNLYLWGPPMLILLFGTHIFLTFKTGFIQKKIGLGIKLSVAKDTDGDGDVSQFGALATALASTIGTGNIVGVATAIASGGPGAVLWMWLTGVFGIATKYSESLLAVKYRVKTSDGTMLGGPMYALERGLNMKWLAVIFSVCTSIAAFGIGNSVQGNAVAQTIEKTFQIPTWISGLVMAVLVGIVILGGVQSITKVCTKLVPFMAFMYVLGCIVILFFYRSYIGQAISIICVSAFTPRAAAGGFIGSSVLMAARYGVARGLFSNESGLGSAPIVAAAAQTRNPVRQALVSATGTFWDTVVVCAMTGLVIVCSIIVNPNIDSSQGAALTYAAFNQIPVLGSLILNFGLITFAFSTILGWSYYGERAMEYLFSKKVIMPYRVLWVIVVFVGASLELPLVWSIADTMNALMAIPNLVAMLLLSGVIAKETKKYLSGDSINVFDATPIPTISDKN